MHVNHLHVKMEVHVLLEAMVPLYATVPQGLLDNSVATTQVNLNLLT